MTDDARPPLRILSVGLGPIGLAAARLVVDRPRLIPVGAVDIGPGLAGGDLGDLLGTDSVELVVEDDLASAIERVEPDVAILCTSSCLGRIAADLELLVDAGVSVVSSCEELLSPTLSSPELAARIDEAARRGGAAVVGTGVNPGFVLDLLPVVLSAPCRRVERVRGLRVVDVSTRRLPLRKKVGVGLHEAAFRELLAGDGIGHVGLPESADLVARGLGFEVDGVSETIEPVLAERAVDVDGTEVAPGAVAGVRHLARARRRDRVVVELELRMYAGAEEPRDEIALEGEPSLRFRIEGGVPGDEATAAILVNSVARIAAAPPGLTTVLDLPPARCA